MAGKRTFASRTFAPWTFNSGHWTGTGTGVPVEVAIEAIDALVKIVQQSSSYTRTTPGSSSYTKNAVVSSRYVKAV